MEIRLKFIYRVHTIKRMFERDISENEIEQTVLDGEIIESYPDDKPYPSYLSLKFFDNKPLHVVYAINQQDNEIILITAYYPDSKKWDKNFKKRLKNEMHDL